MIPELLLISALAAGVGGLGEVLHGINNLAEANEIAKGAENLNVENRMRFEATQKTQENATQALGETQLKVASYFKYFIEAFEKIHNRPEFKELQKSDTVPPFDFNEIKGVTVGAAASAGTTSLVMAVGHASTGAAIAKLSGAALEKAILAWLGGGSIAAGGGGMALGVFVLNSVAGGVGVLFAGAAFAGAGAHANKKAHEVYKQVLINEEEINRCTALLNQITKSSNQLKKAILSIHNRLFVPNVVKLCRLVEQENDWNLYTDEQKKLVENNILLVSILHKLNSTALYRPTKTDDEGNVTNIDTNFEEVEKVIKNAKREIKSIEIR